LLEENLGVFFTTDSQKFSPWYYYYYYCYYILSPLCKLFLQFYTWTKPCF